MSEDLAHDAHLRTALRHAPDHALSPPSGLTQSILAAARQAHRPTEASPAPPPMRLRTAAAPSLRAWLRRMVSPRWAGVWAVAGVAALGLGLWMDFGPRPEIEHTTVAANDATPAAPPGARDEQRREAAKTEPPIARAPAVAQESQRAADRERQSGEGTAAAPPAAAAKAVPPAAGPGAEPRPQTGVGAALAVRRGPEAEASPPLALWRRIQDELATGAARWSWSAPGRPTIRPVDGDAQAWLQRVSHAAQGRWGDAGGRGEPPEATEVRWWRDGWPVATLRIEPDGVRWIEPGGRTRFAPLPAATVQQLRGP